MTQYNKQSDGQEIPVVGVVDAQVYPLGYQQITATAAAVGLTPPAGARIAQIDAEAQPVRWRDDGSNPTATVGMRIPVGSELKYSGDLSAIKFIAETAGAILNVSYYG